MDNSCPCLQLKYYLKEQNIFLVLQNLINCDVVSVTFCSLDYLLRSPQETSKVLDLMTVKNKAKNRDHRMDAMKACGGVQLYCSSSYS